MTATDQQNNPPPVVRIRPPLLFAAALLVGFALDHLLPIPFRLVRDEGLAHKLVPGIFVLIGLAIAASGIRNFAKAGTPVPASREVRTLVTTGIHGWSRNPIYLGMLTLYVGIGIAVRSSWILALAPLVLLILRFAVIGREEDHLVRRFGEKYIGYARSVRRWI